MEIELSVQNGKILLGDGYVDVDGVEDEEILYHPFKSWKTVNRGFKDLIGYTSNQEEHHLSVYQKNDDLVWLDVGGMARSEIQNADSRLVYSYQYSLSAVFSENVIVYSEADIYEMLYNNEDEKMPAEFRGGFPGDVRDGYYGFNKSRGFDYSYGYLQYSSYFGDMILSMEPLVWGNAKKSIILSNNVNPFPALIWKKSIRLNLQWIN